jgi:hypothetical protein
MTTLKSKPVSKLPRRCEFCDEPIRGRWCPNCRRVVAGYRPERGKMPPKTNRLAWLEIGKSVSRLAELRRRKQGQLNIVENE